MPAWKKAIDFPNPDFAALARDCGGKGFKAEKPGELREAISEALKAGTQDAEALLNDYPDPADLWDSLRSREIRRDSMTGRKAA